MTNNPRRPDRPCQHPEGATDVRSYSIPAELIEQLRSWACQRELSESQAVTAAIRGLVQKQSRQATQSFKEGTFDGRMIPCADTEDSTMSTQDAHAVLLTKFTRREFRQRMQAGELKACIIPVAATEQHLEHLAMEHDWRSCMHISTEVAKRLRPQVVVAPVMNIGISEHHMRHIGTLTAMPGSWLNLLSDAIRSMHHAGFTNILVLNGHGGNVAPCHGIWGQFLQRFKINLQFHSYWELMPAGVANAILKTKRFPGHAQEFETAFALAVFPENVRRDAMQDQEDKEPLEATAESGAVLVETIIDAVTKHVAAMIDGTNKVAIPPFHP